MFLKPQFADEFYLLGKGLFSAVKSGHPAQFFREQNVGLVGGFMKGIGSKVLETPNAYKNPLAWGKGILKGGAQAVKEGRSFLGTGWNWSYGSMWPILAAASAYHASKAPRGQKLGTFAGSMVGDFAGATIGAMFFGMPGAFVGNMLLGGRIGGAVTKAFNDSQGYLQRRQSLEMGGRYYDFAAARTMRQVAVAEMSTSLLNARQYLGQEAAALHV